jgi:diguanylate cyclase (GGDEF)-like protein
MQRSANAVIRQARRWLTSSRKISLPAMIILPFILQVVTIVTLVGYLSYRNGQRSVEDLTNQLMDSASKRVEQKLTDYLSSPLLVNQLISNAARRGDLDFDQPNPQAERYLWQQMRLFSNLSWISVGTENGDYLGIWRPRKDQNLQTSLSNRSTQHYNTYYATDDQGQRTARLKVEKPKYDPRTRPWYQSAIATKKLTWTGIYPGFTPGTLFVAASQPLYDSKGTLAGAIGTDISLQDIQTFLTQNSVSSSSKIFLMERSGLLVASSSQERSFHPVNSKIQRTNVLDSQQYLIRAAARSLSERFNGFTTIQKRKKLRLNIDRKPYYVQVLPFSQKPGLDWLIVIVVPESDVMGRVNASTETTIWLCVMALLIVIGLNTLIGHWLVKPIVGLSQVSQQITQGDFSRPVPQTQIQELATLADSFTQMSQEIQQSRRQLEDYSRSLEQKVSDRTSALQQEIQHRRAAEMALQSANQELQQLAYVDGLTHIFNRRQFDERLLLEWRTMKRERLPLSLILCDVDYFKRYNDVYGHQVGDDCLRRIASAIAASARRPSDLVARYGGEEFAVLLPNTSPKGALEVASLIQTQIQQLQLPHRASDVSEYVTVSLGVSTLIPAETTTPQQLLSECDRALYQAKVAGRDHIRIC